MRKSALTLFLISSIVFSLVLVAAVHFGAAQTSGTSVNGVINVDTTWTKAGSPYTFTGPVAINAGVTLTIQPGVIVNMSSGYLEVNGTLNAVGSPVAPIYFNGGGNAVTSAITFYSTSTSWNEQSASGCIIENAVINASLINIHDASPKISDNVIIGSSYGTSGISVLMGSPVISDNLVNVNGIAIWLSRSSSLIFGNTISGSVSSMNSENDNGIHVYDFNSADTSTIQDNLIVNEQYGIYFENPGGAPLSPLVISNNTITDNNYGIYLSCPSISAIDYNNILNNNQYNFYSLSASSYNAQYNWWGTTDTNSISQRIYDYYDNYNLGVVAYNPFLTGPNTEAPTYINATAGSDGSISPNGVISTNYGSSQTFTITPSSGYQTASVLVNGTSVGAVTSYTIQDINGATAISASFVPSPTPSPSPVPTATPSPTPTTSSDNPTSSPTSNSTSTPTSSPTPKIPEFPSLFALAAFLALLLSAVAVQTIRKRTIGKS